MSKLKKLLKTLLAKGFATEAEKAQVVALAKDLEADEAETVADDVEAVADLPEEEDEATDDDEDEEEAEGLDQEGIKALIMGSVQKEAKAAATAAVEKAADEIVAKFMAGAKKGRKTATRSQKAAVGKFEETKSFFKMLFNGDNASLKAAGYLDTGTPGTAGYLVPPAEFIAEVYRIAESGQGYGVARREFRYIPKRGPGNEFQIPALNSSVTATWTGEGETKTSTEPSFDLPTLTLKKLAAIVPWTDEFEEDMGIDAIGLLATLFAEELNKKEDAAFFVGDGTLGFGGFTGILNNGAVNSVVAVSASFLNLKADDLLNMIDGTPAGALNGAKFYMHRSILSVIRKLKTTDGTYIYQNPGAGQPATIWNYPVEIVEAMPSVSDTDVDTPFVIFGNLRSAAIISDKGTLALKVFDAGIVPNVGATGTLNLIAQDMKALRVVRRTAYVLALPTAVTVLKTAASGT